MVILRRVRPLTLSYHAVSESWPSALAIPAATLERQLGHLSRRGYRGMTFAQAERARQDGSLPPRTVVVTFDDAYA